jgi:hypothetical protein
LPQLLAANEPQGEDIPIWSPHLLQNFNPERTTKHIHIQWDHILKRFFLTKEIVTMQIN